MEVTNLYGQFCPVSMASEIVCTRWTPLVIRELLCGSTRFNDIRRGVPKMSPGLLSKRLKELELSGVIRVERGAGGRTEYRLTEAGEELRPLIVGIGSWGQRWVESRLSLRNLDPSLLMWDIRRNFEPDPRPAARCTVQFKYRQLETLLQDWWLVVEPDDTDLCKEDPGYEVDVLIDADLRSMTAVWMGLAPMSEEIDAGRIEIDGAPRLTRQVRDWLKLSIFAHEPRRVP
ncbi:helix-turn-helix domain-containing protein [Psychromarinibacter sp. C21-152]|uniref:Helix-turn-helix domain-containing protein n=1 Tax=Psychromarinibacter sediminicola TaxID=3033385 RepID=A0AAE3NTM7_9RHOB|nr:helix-turn-helix domain-containing protein [Psychromarinibacter sediminicola]MDF0602211.1 helix-turn-helix domain-containing protein [Psychromarinibacter sediminicola]